ncbi:ABC transporter substrate-binding protein [Corynebacterium sp. CCUG 51687]|uniref:ABC transporter substrate-binding protein n=1 Tax=Corynebacterium sp. CCUG 51687 TaxID=2823897 RepID=UPI00210C5504
MNILRKAMTGAVALCAAASLAACSGDSADTTPSAEPTPADKALTVTDVTGREVTFDHAPERIVLGEGRGVFATALLGGDPFDHVVAYGNDLTKAAPAFKDKVFEISEGAMKAQEIGNIGKGDVSLETLMSQDPDVVVMTLDQKKVAEESGLLEKMDQTGMKYVFTDFRQSPLEHTVSSVQLLGDLMGKSERAKEYGEFYESKVEEIKGRVEEAVAKDGEKDGLIWSAAGFVDCCSTPGKANLGQLLTAAGGNNLGEQLITADSKQFSAEKMIELQPENLIVTGGEWARKPDQPDTFSHVELGYQSSPQRAAETLNNPLGTPGLDLLQAPKQGKYFAVYHQFYDNPYNVFALEAFAKWLHPAAFEDMDPAKDFEQFHADWLPFDYSGAFFAQAQQ